MSEEFVTFQDLRRLGLTARQIDYWTSSGILLTIEPANPYPGRDTDNPGIGRHRRWRAGEDYVAGLILEYTRAGIELRAAERAARDDGRLTRRLRITRL